MVALYGRPGPAAMGVLGEQGTERSVQRAQRLAEEYRPRRTSARLDPGWRLGPGQKHPVQVGPVDAAEINRVSDRPASPATTGCRRSC
ncbi:MAG: hypothetical protein V7633_3991 [Pseudonocardia sp.]|jgi:hypothetical protein